MSTKYIPVKAEDWVKMVEATKLAADLMVENERLRSKLNFSQSITETCKQLQEGETITVQGAISSGKTILSWPCQCERLTAENERLRKAGDVTIAAYCMGEKNVEKHKDNPVVAYWLAAKEGRDAK